jgi:hypothetical protein
VFPPGAGYPGVQLDLEMIDGVPQCRAVRVEAREGDREVRAGDLDLIKIADCVEHFFALTAIVVKGQDGLEEVGEMRGDEESIRRTQRIVQDARSAGRKS